MILQKQLLKEIELIPADKYEEIYDLLHYYRLGLMREKNIARKAGLLKGQLDNTFFEPLPEEELNAWENTQEVAKIPVENNQVLKGIWQNKGFEKLDEITELKQIRQELNQSILQKII